MASIYSAAFIVEIDGSDTVNLIQTLPSDALSKIDIREFISCCNPVQSGKGYNKVVDDTFSFSCSSLDSSEDYFFHSLIFEHSNSIWEIIVSTKKPFANLFIEFLQQSKNLFDSFSSQSYTPISRFEFITSILEQWKDYKPDDVNILPFPNDTKFISFNIDYFTYASFDPAEYFDIKSIKKIWLSLFSGSPLVIFAEDACVGSKAAFSAFSLLSPLFHCDKSILWLNEGDPRVTELESGKYKVIVTFPGNAAVKKLKNAKIVNAVKRKNAKSYEKERIKYYNKLTTNCLIVMMAAMNDALVNDPYSDFVNTPFEAKDIKAVMSDRLRTVMPECGSFLEFSKTKTFERWRRLEAIRDETRQYVLSFAPEQCNFENRNKEDLKKIIEGIEELKNASSGDAHLQAVLLLHSQKAEQCLKDNK